MKIFISHISKEKKLALVFKKWVESIFSDQISVFVSSDPDNIPAGNKWCETIISALDESKLLVILYSPLSKTRTWINFEAGCGWIKKIPIIPICHSNLKLEEIGEPISSFQGIEINDKDFPDKFFGAIAKHAGFTKQPKIDKNQFLKEIREALGALDSKTTSEEIPQKKEFILSEEQIKILKSLVDAEDYQKGSVDEPLLAQQLNLKVTLLIHHINPLIEKELVHSGLAWDGPSYYTITQKGISYLVEKGILK